VLKRCARLPTPGNRTLNQCQLRKIESHKPTDPRTRDRNGLGDPSYARLAPKLMCGNRMKIILVSQIERLVSTHRERPSFCGGRCGWLSRRKCFLQPGGDEARPLPLSFSRPGDLRRRAGVHFSELECRNRHLNRDHIQVEAAPPQYSKTPLYPAGQSQSPPAFPPPHLHLVRRRAPPNLRSIHVASHLSSRSETSRAEEHRRHHSARSNHTTLELVPFCAPTSPSPWRHFSRTRTVWYAMPGDRGGAPGS
jgi:hypothetical protein